MLLARDGFGGLGAFGANYVPKPSHTPYTPQPSAGVPYTPQPSTTTKRYTYAELQTKYAEFLQAQTEQQRIEEFGLASMIPTCPPTAMSSATACYNGAAPNLLTPGTFIAYGVPFNVSEFKPGDGRSFSKTVVANPIQREVIERAIRTRSAQVVSKYMSQLAISGYPDPANLSITQLAKLAPDFATNIRGLKYNPILPNDDELNNTGGYRKWIARGGFPLSSGVAYGTISLDEAYSPVVCQSILCRCPVASTRPIACVRAYITKDGAISQHPSSDLASFWVFLKIENDNQITVSLDYVEKTKLQKFGNAMASLLNAIAKTLCVAAPAAKDQMNKLALPKCVDKANKPCKQGATGCTCVTPPDSTAMAVGTTNLVMQKWCEGWAAANAAPIDYPIDNIMPPVQPKPFPWAWLVGGLAVFGGLVYASRR
jgi:hypothetical protein